MSWRDDAEYREETITSVKAVTSAGLFEGWEIGAGGFGIWVPSDICKQAPTPGERIRFYGKGIGYEVRGIVISERVYRYETEADAELRREREKRQQEEERQQKLETERPERDARIAALPEAFRHRIERFQRALPHWRRDFETYELFVCEEATKIAKAVYSMSLEEKTLRVLGSAENIIQTFHDSPEMQKAAGISEEHSGNTFSQACTLALRSLALSPDTVVQSHGALCPLVGCKAYGCFAAYPES